MTEQSFAEMMDRVRAGDETAAAELVRKYERAVRVAVRVKLTDSRMRRQLETMDVCQSVMASFFVRVAAGQFDLRDPQQLVGLLVRMAQNKVLMQVRRHRQQKRDVTRQTPLGDDTPSVADGQAGPARQASGREQLELLLERLQPEERELAQRRMLGQSWDEIAEAVGAAPQALRMRLSRAIDRVGKDLGWDESDLGLEDMAG